MCIQSNGGAPVAVATLGLGVFGDVVVEEGEDCGSGCAAPASEDRSVGRPHARTRRPLRSPERGLGMARMVCSSRSRTTCVPDGIWIEVGTADFRLARVLAHRTTSTLLSSVVHSGSVLRRGDMHLPSRCKASSTRTETNQGQGRWEEKQG
jgi:hypothetical protein